MGLISKYYLEIMPVFAGDHARFLFFFLGKIKISKQNRFIL